MTIYARIQDGTVVEIILPFLRTEEGRPAAPAELREDATEQERETHALAQAVHDAWQVGEVPISERFAPEIVATLVEVPESMAVEQQWSWDGETFSPPAPFVPEPVSADEAQARRDVLLSEATLRIAPLQDAVDLDEATDAELALLKKWKQYRIALSRIETQAGFPADVQWPAVPS